jgi:predicted enzyme related to lactoylglutathione lyase
MAGEVSFFELGVKNPAPAREFYGQLFGWEMNPGPSGEGYGFLIETPNMSGGLHGGDEAASPYLFFAVEDIEAAAERVRDLGGEAEFNEHSGPGPSGTFAFCRDDQGSYFGLHQPPG